MLPFFVTQYRFFIENNFVLLGLLKQTNPVPLGYLCTPMVLHKVIFLVILGVIYLLALSNYLTLIALTSGGLLSQCEIALVLSIHQSMATDNKHRRSRNVDFPLSIAVNSGSFFGVGFNSTLKGNNDTVLPLTGFFMQQNYNDKSDKRHMDKEHNLTQ